jgi:Tfp pilus assembly protein PilX
MNKLLTFKIKQQGTVLFVALVFLVLTSMIAVTTMDAGILSRKMASNNQFKEEAMQLVEGIVNEVSSLVVVAFDEVKAPQLGDVLCAENSADAFCTPSQKKLFLSKEMVSATYGGVVKYQAIFVKEGLKRSSELQASQDVLQRFVEVEGSFDGIENSLSQASLVIGFMNQALLVDSGAIEVVAEGAGTGSYMLYQ